MGDGLVDFRNYPTPEDFLRRGIGFIVEHNGEIVSGCTSYAVGGGKFDISVTTRREHQRRGMAQAVAARMISYCPARGHRALLGCAERSRWEPRQEAWVHARKTLHGVSGSQSTRALEQYLVDVDDFEG